MGKADELRLAQAKEIMGQAERYIRWANGQGEFAPPQTFWQMFFRGLPPLPPMPVCAEQVEWAEGLLANQEVGICPANGRREGEE